MQKKTFSCELALVLAMLINSLSVSLMVKANLGISTLSSVPLALSYVHSGFSLGLWNFIYQVGFLLLLVFLTRNYDPKYLLSFVVARAFGYLLDFWNAVLSPLPDAMAFRAAYCVIGLIAIAFGASLFNKCRLPILPLDAFLRDFSNHFKFHVKWVKTILDALSVIATSIITLVFLGGIEGIGAGTLLSVVFTGMLIGRFCDMLDRKYTFIPTLPFSKILLCD